MMIYNKEWYKSKTIISAAVALLVAIISAMFGETDPIVAAIITVLSALGVYGRVTATHKLV